MSAAAGLVLVAVPTALGAYAYAGYPALLWLLSRGRRGEVPREARGQDDWPEIAILVPAYNEAAHIGATLDALLAADYPRNRRQVYVLSDASDDGTDEIVRGYADRGVHLFRAECRLGKTELENSLLRTGLVTAPILVNTDAKVRLHPGALLPLVAVFRDPTIGAASGRDVSVGDVDTPVTGGESGYVGYEMWVRQLETRLGGIIGASGCLYAIRREIVDPAFPGHLSRDFASPLETRLHGLRTVSVDAALCFVPRSRSLRVEFHRKVRTMARGLATLWHFRRLLDPLAHGRFAWMLWSHKLVRWLAFLTAPLALPGFLLLTPVTPLAWLPVAGAGVAAAAARAAYLWPEGRAMPRWVALPGFAMAGVVAAVLAWITAIRGRSAAVWEPTRR